MVRKVSGDVRTGMGWGLMLIGLVGLLMTFLKGAASDEVVSGSMLISTVAPCVLSYSIYLSYLLF